MKRQPDIKLIMLICTLLMCMTIAPQSLANSQPNAAKFPLLALAQLPILHEGRIKPLDSFARAKKKYLSGSDRAAMRWLRDVIFNPAAGEAAPIIKITHPQVLNMLQLEKRKTKLYSQRELRSALYKHAETLQTIRNTDQDNWTSAQRSIVEIEQKLFELNDLLASLTAFIPLAGGVPPAGALDLSSLPQSLQNVAGQELSFWQAQKIQQDVREYAENLAAQKGKDLERYTALEQSIVHLAFSIDGVAANGQVSEMLRIVPIIGEGQKKLLNATMSTPWQMMINGASKPAHADLFQSWKNLVQAYHDEDATNWNRSANQVLEITRQLVGQSNAITRVNALDLEYHITQLAPLLLTKILYMAALIIASLGYFLSRLSIMPSTSRAYNIAAMAGVIGAACHTLYLCARMYILQRPPVSTLFESILFVSALVVIVSLVFFYKHKQNFWLFAGVSMGILLQILALSHDQDGDSMIQLGAVLNTNFWLATHVICITVGYGYCVLTSLLAHYSLGRAAITGQKIKQDDIQKMMHGLALMSLLFTAVGTILGGIWADQSWGRFWGWDPKENGALLIVLWLVWVLHGRISGQMKTVSYTAGLAYLTVITALSWFGVNLLSVGLHSYGFTKGAELVLFSFIALETILIGGLCWRIYHTQKAAKL